MFSLFVRCVSRWIQAFDGPSGHRARKASICWCDEVPPASVLLTWEVPATHVDDGRWKKCQTSWLTARWKILCNLLARLFDLDLVKHNLAHCLPPFGVHGGDSHGLPTRETVDLVRILNRKVKKMMTGGKDAMRWQLLGVLCP